MTSRLTPVESSGVAEALLADMLVQVGHEDVFGDVADGGGKWTRPRNLCPPVALEGVFELLLDFAR